MLTPIQVILAVLVVAGGVAAVAAPNPRHATIGAFGAMLVAGLVADPMPFAAAVVARLAGAALGGWLVWLALRSAPASGTRASVGWAGAAGIAVAAFAIGWLAATALAGGLAGLGAASTSANVAGASLSDGSLADRAAIAAAAALAVLAAAPVVLPRDGHRLGLGLVLLLAAAGLLVGALGAAPDDTLELALGLLAALAGAAVAAVTAALLGAAGDLALRDPLSREPAVRHRPADDAHRGPAS